MKLNLPQQGKRLTGPVEDEACIDYMDNGAVTVSRFDSAFGDTVLHKTQQ
jgi:hypothetical protein